MPLAGLVIGDVYMGKERETERKREHERKKIYVYICACVRAHVRVRVRFGVSLHQEDYVRDDKVTDAGRKLAILNASI